MAVPTITLYASSPSSVCSHDFDLNSRSSSSTSSTAFPQKAVVGGLSFLLSSPSARHSSSASYLSGGTEDLGLVWQDRGEELNSSFRCSSLSSSLKRDQSPVSVLQIPGSSSGPSAWIVASSKSPPKRIGDIWSIHSGSGGLFNRFVRHALGSYVDLDPVSLNNVEDTDSASSGLLDELTFSMEDNALESTSKLEPYAKDLLLDAQSRHKIFHDDLVVNAFYEAEKAHKGQVRASGGPYLQHCIETAVLLATIGANSTVVSAGLLHDTLDDTFMTYDYIFQTFGADVADLVEGVSKLSQLSKLARHNNTANRTVEADRLHTMFLAMADARAVLVKLADRLHNMVTLDALPFTKQQRFAKETLEIFAPLANRLGIFTWKEQLENLCFKHLNPDQHRELSLKLVNSFDEAMITSAVEKLDQALKDGAISYHTLHGRHKSLYSIYSKMLKKKLNVDEIHDIHGLRLIVETKEDCYKALRIIHQLWDEVPGRFKDYIEHPKFNGYQSLHTVVIGGGMMPLEIQIRTKDMHLQAEYGFAAHWRYKEGDCKHSSFVLQMVEWARWVVTRQCQTIDKGQLSFGPAESVKPPCKFLSHSEDCPSYKPDEPVYVIIIENEKMLVQEFGAHSTIMDLLEKVGCKSSRSTPYGIPAKEELRPRVNHKPITDPTCKLKMGDVIELTPAIPDESLTEYRVEIQRMFDRDSSVGGLAPSGTTVVSSRS